MLPSLAWIPASQSALRASHVCQPNLSEIVPAPPVQESIVCDRTIVLAIHRAIHTRPLPTSVSLPGGDGPALVAKVKSYDGGSVALSVDTGNWVRAGRGGGHQHRRSRIGGVSRVDVRRESPDVQMFNQAQGQNVEAGPQLVAMTTAAWGGGRTGGASGDARRGMPPVRACVGKERGRTPRAHATLLPCPSKIT